MARHLRGALMEQTVSPSRADLSRPEQRRGKTSETEPVYGVGAQGKGNRGYNRKRLKSLLRWTKATGSHWEMYTTIETGGDIIQQETERNPWLGAFDAGGPSRKGALRRTNDKRTRSGRKTHVIQDIRGRELGESEGAVFFFYAGDCLETLYSVPRSHYSACLY